MIFFDFNTSAFNRQLTELSVLTGLSSAAAVTRTSRLWLRDCIRATPPTGNGKAFSSKSAQKAMGEKAITRDVASRAFPLLSKLKIMSDPESRLGKRISDLVDSGNYKQATSILQGLGIRTSGVIARPTDGLHRKLRSKRTGRVRAKVSGYLVADDSAQAAYLRSVLKRSGRAKNGWERAARSLKMPRPGWGSARSVGHFRPISDKRRPVIEFGNGTDFLQDSYYVDSIMRRTLAFRARAMEKELERFWRGAANNTLGKLHARFANGKDTFEALA